MYISQSENSKSKFVIFQYRKPARVNKFSPFWSISTVSEITANFNKCLKFDLCWPLSQKLIVAEGAMGSSTYWYLNTCKFHEILPLSFWVIVLTRKVYDDGRRVWRTIATTLACVAERLSLKEYQTF